MERESPERHGLVVVAHERRGSAHERLEVRVGARDAARARVDDGGRGVGAAAFRVSRDVAVHEDEDLERARDAEEDGFLVARLQSPEALRARRRDVRARGVDVVGGALAEQALEERRVHVQEQEVVPEGARLARGVQAIVKEALEAVVPLRLERRLRATGAQRVGGEEGGERGDPLGRHRADERGAPAALARSRRGCRTKDAKATTSRARDDDDEIARRGRKSRSSSSSWRWSTPG